MRPLALALILLGSLTLAGSAARAEPGFLSDLFGSAERTPANPFASNYASPPVRGDEARAPRTRREPAPGPLRPPRDIPR